jgi:hypothetical protein
MASVPRDSAFFSGGSVIYEVTSGGQLKSYVDKSASGGSLMTAVKSYTSDWTTHRKRLWSNGVQIFSISMKWSGAVSAFGVGLSGSTQYDRDHKQRITAGERNNSRHYIWGRNGSVSGKPGVFYSY